MSCLLSLRAQIADFGFAAVGSVIGEAPMLCQSIVGSKTYMAPEVLCRRSNTFTHPANGYHGALVSPSLVARFENCPENHPSVLFFFCVYPYELI